MNDADFARAKTFVFRWLNIRMRSEAEIREKLATKEIDNETIDRTVAYFKSLDLINDRQFALQWIAARHKRPYGANRIKSELILKGIDRDIIAELLRACAQDFDQESAVAQLAKQQFKKHARVDRLKAKQRVYGFLIRRGFDTSIISKVMKDY